MVPVAEGRIHPVSQVLDEVVEIFADMGFAVAEGPDIETDEMNFDKLNIPAEHPARQDHDTFYFAPKPDGSRLLLRTHTSPVQIRTMVSQKPPIRIIAPGRVYRCDSDQTHTPMFHQVEGLVIDETTHIGHLKWVLQEFCKAFFEVDEVKMRFRASHSTSCVFPRRRLQNTLDPSRRPHRLSKCRYGRTPRCGSARLQLVEAAISETSTALPRDRTQLPRLAKRSRVVTVRASKVVFLEPHLVVWA